MDEDSNIYGVKNQNNNTGFNESRVFLNRPTTEIELERSCNLKNGM